MFRRVSQAFPGISLKEDRSKKLQFLSFFIFQLLGGVIGTELYNPNHLQSLWTDSLVALLTCCAAT